MPSSSCLRRCFVALVPALLLVPLAACSTKTGYGDSTVSGLDAFTVGGTFGKTPTISWNAQPGYPTNIQTKTLVKGSGPEVSDEDPLKVKIYLADPLDDLYTARNTCHSSASPSADASAAGSGSAGASKSKAPKSKAPKSTAATPSPAAPSAAPSVAASPSASAAPTPVTVSPCPDDVSFPLKGAWVYQSQAPESLTLSQVSPVFQQALTGATVGSRVEVLAGSPDIFPAQQQGAPAGQPQLGIGTQDPLVMVLDVLKQGPKPLSGPKGTSEKSPSWAPKVTLDAKKDPTGMDFKGLPKPKANGKLMKAILIKGTGAKVKASDTLTVNYYGMVYGAKKPFDESYTKQPASFSLSGVVKGWKDGLTGVPVGSRVLLQIPPALGYGSQAQSGIPANSTLYFVIDVLSAG